jgi:Activator of Hsp90 ATPase homolog 1-like protein
MAKTVEEAVVRKSIRVQASIERAFSVFVEQMEMWWPAEHHIGEKPFESIIVEPRVGGRWYERDAEGKDCLWGWVRAWDPPRLVTFSWHLGPNWQFSADLAKASDVAIRFTSEGPSATLVELEHSGIERHGEGYEQLRVALDGPDAWTRTLAEFAKAADGEVQG